MERNQFQNLQSTALLKAAEEETSRQKSKSLKLLKKYFIKSDELTGEYYYEDNGKKGYYLLNKSKKAQFEREVIELGKDHCRIYIKMIDKRPNDYKMLLAMTNGYFMQDLNFTVFDLADNILSRKYEGAHFDIVDKHKHNCIKCRIINPNIVNKEVSKEELKEEALKLFEIAKILDKELTDRQKDDIKRSKYGPDIGMEDSWEKRFTLYLGCEIFFDTDMSWFDIYLQK